METTIWQKPKKNGGQFKSYYVVWKQKKMAYMETDISMFKSYYVVWKQEY